MFTSWAQGSRLYRACPTDLGVVRPLPCSKPADCTPSRPELTTEGPVLGTREAQSRLNGGYTPYTPTRIFSYPCKTSGRLASGIF